MSQGMNKEMDTYKPSQQQPVVDAVRLSEVAPRIDPEYHDDGGEDHHDDE